jgi:hypothetical protein
LRIKEAPASALMRELAKPAYGQLRFEYDADVLAAAGISLDKRISLEVKDARIEALLKATFEPLGIAFELDDRTVRLKPKGGNVE